MDKKDALNRLIELINGKFGITPASTGDFVRLSDVINNETGRYLSVSTLKRVWGYVRYGSFPAYYTLHTLSIFNGYADWYDYLKKEGSRSNMDAETSGFTEEMELDIPALAEGDVVSVNWNEGKGCRLEYLGDNRFRVKESSNIKLQPGDRFTIDSLKVGSPFRAKEISRDDELIPGYIGARSYGVAWFKVERRK